MNKELFETAEQKRLEENQKRPTPLELWGPYLSERQWGTVREDYSANGDAWNYFSHDQADQEYTDGAKMALQVFLITHKIFVSH